MIDSLGYEVSEYPRLRRTRTGRGEKYDGRRVASNSLPRPEIPLPLLHAVPAGQALESINPFIYLKAADNYNAAHQVI